MRSFYFLSIFIFILFVKIDHLYAADNSSGNNTLAEDVTTQFETTLLQLGKIFNDIAE